jgi:septum formation protein
MSMLLHDQLKNYRLILASQSPRRRMLLEGLDLSFEVEVKDDIDENYPEELSMTEIPEFLARKKSDQYADLLTDNTILITADTIVWFKGRVVRKPLDKKDAQHIIKSLAGHPHTVITGVCIRSKEKQRVFHSVSEVHFSDLLQTEIEYYIEKYKPFDKAGAYGIQEWIGYIGIEKIEGSFYNVMGLPVQMLYHELYEFVN